MIDGGTLELQVCAACGEVQYPAREVCSGCLHGTLETRAVSGAGELLSWTRLHVSLDPMFQDRLPWRIASVRLEAGPVVIVHWHGDVAPVGASVQVSAIRDPGGRQVLIAAAAGSEPIRAADVFGLPEA